MHTSGTPQVRVLLARQHDRVQSVLLSAGLRRAKAAELTSLVVAVNQSLGVLSRAGSPAGELRSVVRATCAAVSDAVQHAGSDATRAAYPAHAGRWAAAKGGLEVLTRYQAAELAYRGIRVNTVTGGSTEKPERGKAHSHRVFTNPRS